MGLSRKGCAHEDRHRRAGIAGPTLAYWLCRYGHEPTLIEKAPRLRTGGYVVDFWGGGYAVAERMGLAPELHAAGYAVQELRLVDRDSRKVGGFSAESFRRNLDGRFTSAAWYSARIQI
nr:hypothetical protein [Mycobacterium interjectum]